MTRRLTETQLSECEASGSCEAVYLAHQQIVMLFGAQFQDRACRCKALLIPGRYVLAASEILQGPILGLSSITLFDPIDQVPFSPQKAASKSSPNVLRSQSVAETYVNQYLMALCNLRHSLLIEDFKLNTSLYVLSIIAPCI